MTKNRQKRDTLWRVAKALRPLAELPTTSKEPKSSMPLLKMALMLMVCAFAGVKAHAASYIVPYSGTTTVTVTNGDIIRDHAGTSSYSDNANGTLILRPATTSAKITISFNSVTLETCCDGIAVYNGDGTFLGSFSSGTPTFTSTAADGSLRVVF